MLRVFSIEVAAHEKSDLEEEPIVKRLRYFAPTMQEELILGWVIQTSDSVFFHYD